MTKKFTLQPIKPGRDDAEGVNYTEVFYRRRYIGVMIRIEAEDDVKFYFTTGYDFPRPFRPNERDPVFTSQKDTLRFVKTQHKAKIKQAREELVRLVTSMVEAGVTDAGLRDYLNGVRKRVKKMRDKKVDGSKPVALKKAA